MVVRVYTATATFLGLSSYLLDLLFDTYVHTAIQAEEVHPKTNLVIFRRDELVTFVSRELEKVMGAASSSLGKDDQVPIEEVIATGDIVNTLFLDLQKLTICTADTITVPELGEF